MEHPWRVEQIKALDIFDDVFLHEVYQPILAALGVHHREVRGPRPDRKSRGSGASDSPAAPFGRGEQALADG